MNIWPPPPTVGPPASPTKKPSTSQLVLIYTLVYLFISALFFGGFLASNSVIAWVEDRPIHESGRHLAIRSLVTPLMLWVVSAVTKFVIRIFHRDHNKSVS